MPRDNDEPSTPARPLPLSTTFTFTQIIDADHFTIQRLAARIRKIIASLVHPPDSTADSTPVALSYPALLASLKPPLLEVTWRLIRHDLSEDLVMRPAFGKVLGPKGREMAEHDRSDHANGRDALLIILSQLSALEQDATAIGDRTSRLTDLTKLVTTAFDDLGEHMALESGKYLPYFETVIDEATSHRLAQEYANTLFMVPHLQIPGRQAPFPDGVHGYVTAPLDVLRGIYVQLMQESERDEAMALAIRDVASKEIEALQVGKWMGMNEWMALGGGGTPASSVGAKENTGGEKSKL